MKLEIFAVRVNATLFIPYVLLWLRPKLDPERKNPLEKKELIAFVEKVMILLKPNYLR